MLEEMEVDMPTEAALQNWLDTHVDDYRIEASYSLRQVYFDPQRPGHELTRSMKQTLTRLNAGTEADVGDATLLPTVLDKAPSREVARIFGNDFLQALSSLPEGEWSGPIRSAYGLHLVRIDAHVPGHTATLAEVRQALEGDLLKVRSDRAKQRFYAAVRTHYRVVIDPMILALLSAENNASTLVASRTD